jgi:hypothetical protein
MVTTDSLKTEAATSNASAVIETAQPIAARLYGLMTVVLESGSIPKIYHKIIVELVKGFLKRSNEAELKKSIEELRDKYIPWVLDGREHTD